MIPTLADIQKSWMAACRGPEIDRPSCFDRPGFVDMVYSHEFQTQYEFRQSRECCHWKPGGNAFVRPYCDSAGGKRTPWSACHNCKWRSQ